jgi:hypothetical protein
MSTGDSANLADAADLACWDSGFESRCRHGYLSLLSAVCCHVEVSATADPSSRGVKRLERERERERECVCVCVCAIDSDQEQQ